MNFYETSQLRLFSDLVSDKGTTGQCVRGCFPVPTTVIRDGKRLCSYCLDDKYEKNFVYDEFDGKFECPAKLTNESCWANHLSPREFWIGTCCEAASRWKNSYYRQNDKVDDQMVKVLRKYYLETKRSFQEAEKESETCVRDIGSMQVKSFELERTAIEAELAARNAISKAEKAKKEAEDAKKKLEERKKKAENLQKRVRSVKKDYERTRKRMRLLSSELPEAYGRNCVTESVERSCPICFEEYAKGEDLEHQESALPCGHRFCFPCIVQCKECPTCRKKFTKRQIYKLFSNE